MNDKIMTPQMRTWVELSQGMVRSIASKIHSKLPTHVSYDDVVGYGQVGLMQAAYAYQPEQGVAFQTFAYYRIRGAIYDGLSKMSWASRAVRQRLRAEQIGTQMLEQQLILAQSARTTTESSLADDAQWIVKSTEQLTMVQLLSESEGGSANAVEQIADDRPTPDEEVSQRELCAHLVKLVDALPATDRELIRLTYFDGLSLTDAAVKLGKSKSWASRVHTRILEQLGHSLTLQGAC